MEKWMKMTSTLVQRIAIAAIARIMDGLSLTCMPPCSMAAHYFVCVCCRSVAWVCDLLRPMPEMVDGRHTLIQ
jgi:hypothetical protein